MWRLNKLIPWKGKAVATRDWGRRGSTERWLLGMGYSGIAGITSNVLEHGMVTDNYVFLNN